VTNQTTRAPAPPLACSVRGCGRPLERRERTFVCAKRHSYDIARRGYVNLLQPQDRRSVDAGDSKASIAARARLLAAGVGQSAVEAFVARAAALDVPDHPVVCDLGCGSGEALSALTRRRPIVGIGIDLATPAIERAAQQCPQVTWVVANADRQLPLLDRCVHVLLSLHARRNPAECARVIVPRGFLLVAVPAVDDLIELRTAVQGDAVERDRIGAVLAEHRAAFQLVDRWTVRDRPHLDREQLLDLLRGTYRGARTATAARTAALSSMRVTLASDIGLLVRIGD
jgi:23S rRNA (guanine745-N1)-methyltransferase